MLDQLEAKASTVAFIDNKITFLWKLLQVLHMFINLFY
ncbi:hypothetical protein SynROS8604_00258 [Synechococcus sp. ROS8604]|nr:hypothetical protein SynROS8604_00258 [Synechococcus sp. ROS8604]